LCLNKILEEQNENPKQKKIKYWRNVLEGTVVPPYTVLFRGQKLDTDNFLCDMQLLA
jgi:hypothetical protein